MFIKLSNFKLNVIVRKVCFNVSHVRLVNDNAVYANPCFHATKILKSFILITYHVTVYHVSACSLVVL